MKVKSLSHIRLLATPRTAAHQAPLSTGFSRQEYWSGVPLPSPNTTLYTAKSLQSCLTLWDPIDSSPPGSPVPGILQARTLEWVAFPSPMHESEKWKWSCSVMSDPQRSHRLQPSRLLRPWDFPGKSTGVGCHCLLRPHYTGWSYFAAGQGELPVCIQGSWASSFDYHVSGSEC